MNKHSFFRCIRESLKDLGVSDSLINSFMNNESTLEELGMCISVSIAFDEIMTVKCKYYGCMRNEKIEDIWEYNKKCFDEEKRII